MRLFNIYFRRFDASNTWVIISLFAVYSYLAIRGWGMYPSVFPDEYLHSRIGRLVPFEEATIPSYLYYAIYSMSGYFDDKYLEVARLLNIMFFIIGCYFIYLSARIYISDTQALITSVFVALSPINSYTTYYMPESMYFGILWLFIYTMLKPSSEVHAQTSHWIFQGVLYGALALVKPHATFLYPSIILYYLFTRDARKGTILQLFVFSLVSVLTKFGVGYVFAGLNGITIFGSSYTDHAQSVISDSGRILNYIDSIIFNIIGNIFLTLSVVGLGAVTLLSFDDWRNAKSKERSIRILSCSILITLIPMSSIFSTSVALYDDNVDYRLYMRYYSFIFPIIYILAFARSKKITDTNRSLWQVLLGTILLIFSLVPAYYYTLNRFFYPFHIYFTDTPEFYLIQSNWITLIISVIISLITTVLWLFKEHIGYKIYVYFFVPLIILCTIINSPKAYEQRYNALPQDLAGIFIRSNIPATQHSKIMIVGQSIIDSNHVAMYSYSGNTIVENYKYKNDFSANLISSDIKWLVLIGHHLNSDEYAMVWRHNGISIFKKKCTK